MKNLPITLAVMSIALSAGFVFCQEDQSAVSPKATTEKKKEEPVPPKEEPEEVRANRWMKAKQRNAHLIFDGLTEGDFEKVAKGAKFMRSSGALERWLSDQNYFDHYAYDGQANTFNYAVRELQRHAERNDIQGALNAYVMLSQTCVRCHSVVRDVEVYKSGPGFPSP